MQREFVCSPNLRVTAKQRYLSAISAVDTPNDIAGLNSGDVRWRAGMDADDLRIGSVGQRPAT